MPASIKQLANSKVLKDDVFAKWSDGLYYQAKILEFNLQKRQCLVVFEDDAKGWINAQDLHAQLNSDIDEDNIVCCVCDDGLSKAPNQIIMCDCCEQGYHMQCHKPALAQEIDDEDKDWICSTCSAMSKARKSGFAVNKQDDRPKAKRVKMDTPAKRPTLTIRLSSDKKADAPGKVKTLRKARTTRNAESSKKQANKETSEPPVAEIVEEKTEEVVGEEVDVQAVEPESKAISKNYKIPKIVKVGTTKNVRTKAQMKDMSGVDYSISKEPLEDGTVVEEMHPVLIEAAKEVIANGFGTEEFVDIVADDATNSNPCQNILTEVRPNKRARKTNKTAAA